MTVAVLIGLAAPLLGYVEARLRRPLLSETAMLHFAGATSSGKTTLARVTQSVAGSPRELCDYRATDRGVAEECFARNDMVAIFDEAEHGDATDQQMYDSMKRTCQSLTSGRSRRTTGSLKHVPELRWTCFGVSSGPLTQHGVSRQLGKLRHGQQARFIDIAVLAAQHGGIFDKMHETDGDVSARSARLVKQVEVAMGKHYGVLLDAWIKHLLAKDQSERIEKLTDWFARQLAGDAWRTRWSRRAKNRGALCRRLCRDRCGIGALDQKLGRDSGDSSL